MITLSCRETFYTYNLYHIVKAFFPESEIRQTVEKEQELLVKLVLDEGSCFSVPKDMEKTLASRDEQKKWVTSLVYDWLSVYTGKHLSWGMLTGVRPTKLAMRMLDDGKDIETAAAYMKKEYKVTEEKAMLASQIAGREQALLSSLDYQNGFSLYVGIPFCPSICSYCSFGSSLAELWQDRMEEYLDALFQEIRAIGRMTAGKKLDTVYIGGGTPIILEAEQLERLLSLIDEMSGIS